MKLVLLHPDGSTEGADPRDLPRELLAQVHPPAPLLRVIRKKCVDCCAGQLAEVRRCTAVRCALWPYRMGRNPFSTRRGNPAAFRKNPRLRRGFSEQGSDIPLAVQQVPRRQNAAPQPGHGMTKRASTL